MKKTVLGVDVGGSHITAAVVDMTGKAVVPHSLVRQKIDADASASTIIDCWTTALQAAETAWGGKCTYLAVSMPGPFDYERGISLIKGMHKYEALYGKDIKQAFAERMKIPPSHIQFMNDAEAFLRGEIWASAHSDEKKVLGITLGTGLGSALFEEGAVADLNLGSSLFLDGIAEDYISTRGILTFYRSLGGTGITDVKMLVEQIDMDSSAGKAIGQLAVWLSDFLLVHLSSIKPERVIIGGNISKAHRLFLPAVSRILLKNNVSVPMQVAALGEQAAILGAASFVNYLKNNK